MDSPFSLPVSCGSGAQWKGQRGNDATPGEQLTVAETHAGRQPKLMQSRLLFTGKLGNQAYMGPTTDAAKTTPGNRSIDLPQPGTLGLAKTFIE